MKIEEELKQEKKFTTEHERAFVNVMFTSTWLEALHKDFLKQFDISGQQYNILRILRGQFPKPATVNLLKERMLDKMSDASRLVDRLLKKGLVQRSTCSEDRRAVDIIISKDGLALLKKIDEEHKNFNMLLSHLSETEMKQLNILLDKLRG